MVIWKRILLLSLTAVALFAAAVNYKYDDAGRLTAVSYPDGTTIAYTYDAAGNLLSRTVTPPVGQVSDLPQSRLQDPILIHHIQYLLTAK